MGTFFYIKTGKWSEREFEIMPELYSLHTLLVHMWSIKVAEVFLIRVGRVISGKNDLEIRELM